MMKNFFRKIVTTVIAALSIGSFSPLTASATTFDLDINSYYNEMANKFFNIDWTMKNNGTSADNIKVENITDKNKVSKNIASTNNTSTNTTSANVQGLPNLPTNHSITVQASAEEKILQLMNEKRKEAGLEPLTMDNTLVEVARYKSNHMIQNNYFGHVNPDGTKWTNWLQNIGYKYTTSGENIAYNTYDPVELFNQWWNSPGHRANMMKNSYTKVGIGVVHGNNKYMGTQTFSN